MSQRSSTTLLTLALAALGAFGCGSDGNDNVEDAGNDSSTPDASSTCLEISSAGGGPCGCDLDCPATGSCVTEEDTGFPQGFCLVPCDLEEPAPEGLECVELAVDAALFESCDGTRSCREGWFCAVDATTKIGRCDVRCSSDDHCLTGHCNLYTGWCEPDTDGGGVEAACILDADCKSGNCAVFGEDDGWCMVSCNADDGVCPEDATCVPIGTEPGDNRGVCFHF
jgi:hypothetical protein